MNRPVNSAVNKVELSLNEMQHTAELAAFELSVPTEYCHQQQFNCQVCEWHSCHWTFTFHSTLEKCEVIHFSTGGKTTGENEPFLFVYRKDYVCFFILYLFNVACKILHFICLLQRRHPLENVWRANFWARGRRTMKLVKTCLFFVRVNV